MKRSLTKIGIVMMIMMAFSVNRLMAFTAVASGDWSNAATWGGVAPGGTVTNQDIIIPVGITVNLDMNVTFTGLLNTFSVDGTLSTGLAYGVTMTSGAFTGAGTVTMHSLSFTGLLTSMSSTGTFNLHIFQNNGSSLGLTAVVSIADTLDLISGSLSVNTGANLTPQTNATIKVDAGTITIGGGVFNTGGSYNVMYVGTSKTAGIELNTVTLNNLYLQMDSNSETITTAGNLEVNGVLYMTMGTLDFSGRELTLSGNMLVSNGAMLESNALSSLTLEGPTALASGLEFELGSALLDLTISKSGSGDVKLVSGLNIAGTARLADGDFSIETGGTLTMNAGSTVRVEEGMLTSNGGVFVGTAAYNVAYMGSSNTTGLEVSGTGLNNVTVNLTSAMNEITMGADVTVGGAMDFTMGKWNLSGHDLILDGTFDQAMAASFVGNSNSNLVLSFATSSADTLRFDNANQFLKVFVLDLPVSGMVTLGSDLTIATQMTMTRGRLDIGMYDLAVEPAATIVGYSDSNYVVTSGTGRLKMTVNTAAPFVIFPIGTQDNYSPAMLQQTANGTTSAFMVNTRPGFLAQGTSGFNYATSGSLVDRTWLVEAGAGATVNLNMKLGWMPAAQVNSFDPLHAYITHYTNGAWDYYPESAAVGGANGTFELTRYGVTSLSPFGVVDTALALSIPAPLVASAFQAYPNPATDVLHLSFAQQVKGYDFVVTDLSGRTMTAGTHRNGMNDVDVSMLGSGCYLLKISELGSNQGAMQKFIKL